MGKIIAIANQKGGVGKTTTANALGIGLTTKGKKVLLIDNDPQGNLTQSLGFQFPKEIEKTISTIFWSVMNDNYEGLDDCIIHCENGTDLIPANTTLTDIVLTLTNASSREHIMEKYLDTGVADRYDYIIIDCSPDLGLLTLNALVAADSVIIPAQATYFAAKGLESLFDTIIRIKKDKYLNPRLKIEGILITMFDSRTNFAKDIVSILEETYPEAKMFESKIPVSIKAQEALPVAESIYEYDPNGKVAVAYGDFVEEVLKLE